MVIKNNMILKILLINSTHKDTFYININLFYIFKFIKKRCLILEIFIKNSKLSIFDANFKENKIYCYDVFLVLNKFT